MRVLFVFSNVVSDFFIPISIPLLSGIAKKRKWECEVFDTRRYKQIKENFIYLGGFNEPTPVANDDGILIENLQNTINSFNPNLIVVTTSHNNYEFLASCISNVKVPQNTFIVIAGAYATLSPDNVLKSKIFDVAVIGECETALDEILESIERRKSLDNISGTYLFDKQSETVYRGLPRIFHNPSFIWDIEEDYSSFESNFYHYVESSRGCPFDCHYCGNGALRKEFKGYGEFVRIRPINSLFNHLERLEKKHKGGYRFIDGCFLCKPTSWLEEFSKKYSQLCNKPIIISSSPETITKENVEILLKCGVKVEINLGVESGSEKILKNVCNRQCSIKDITKAFNMIRASGIFTIANVMIGLPCETREDVFKTIELLKILRPTNYTINTFIPYPGIKLYEMNVPPAISQEEIINLKRVFDLYIHLPKEYYPLVEKCEKDYNSNTQLFKFLTSKR